MLYNVIYPEVKQKYLMVSELNVDWKKSPFDVFYANILINHNVSYSDKLELLKIQLSNGHLKIRQVIWIYYL